MSSPEHPPMIYRRLGRTGLKVSVLSFGAWVTFGDQVDVLAATKLMQRARDAGVNFFDNAEIYGNGKAEEVMGEALRELGWPRSSYVLSTKVFWGGPGPNDTGLSRKHVVEALDASLARLGVSYVDVFLAHRPDPDTPIEETVRAFNHVIEQGKALYWGTSEWSAAQIEAAWAVADRLGLIGPCCEQPQYNLLERNKVEGEFLQLFETRGTGTTIWSPLASGVLTGKYCSSSSGGGGTSVVIPEGSRLSIEKYKTMLAGRLLAPDVLEKVSKLRPVSERLGCSLAQLAIAFCARNENVSTVLLGATSERQLDDNLGALAVVPKLTAEVMAEVEAVMGTKPEAARRFR